LAIALLCTAVPAFAEGEAVYSDIEGHWAREAIERWTSRGIIEGYGGEFRPDEVLTRAQIAKILSVLLGLPEASGNPFPDVSEGDWFAQWIMRCYEAGIIVGNGAGADPNGQLTREQAVVMLSRALELPPEDERTLEVFSDFDRVSGWAAPYAAAVVSRGFVSGSGGRFLPGDGMTRAEFMSMLDRAVVQYISEGGEYDLAESGGIVLCAAPEVVLAGDSSASVLISRGADGGTVSFSGCTLEGALTVAADNVLVSWSDSSLPAASVVGRRSVVCPDGDPTEELPGAMSQESVGLLLSPGETRVLVPVLYPEVPEVPEDPEIPEDPEVPENPEVPEDPEVPEVPEDSEVPEDPEASENPEDPGVTEDPEVPKDPEAPEDPKAPEASEVPEDPETPENPEPSEDPDAGLSWASSNSEVVEVSQDGTVSAAAPGSARVTVSAASGIELVYMVTVRSIAPVNSIFLGTESISLRQGETYAFWPVLRPDWAPDKSLVWSSSDETVAAVSQYGVVSTGELGNAVITAASPGGASASCAVEVKSPLRDLSGVEAAVRNAVSGYGGRWSVYVQDVGTGSKFSLNNDRERSASVIKLYVMAAILEGLENGTVRDSQKIQSQLHAMITYSSNDAWTYLASVLGGGNYYTGMGKVTEFCLRNGYVDSGRIEKNGLINSFTSVNDTGLFLSRVLDGTNVSQAASAKMLELLKAQTRLNKIPAGVPKGIVTANKTGELYTTPVQNDAAIIYAPKGTYILVVMTYGGSIKNIRELSSIVYAEMDK